VVSASMSRAVIQWQKIFAGDWAAYATDVSSRIP
jgi:hypothetical protein